MFGYLVQTSRDKVPTLLREVLWELRWVSVNNCSQLREHVCICLRWVRILAYRHLDHGKAQRPHVGGDGVCGYIVLRLALDALGL